MLGGELTIGAADVLAAAPGESPVTVTGRLTILRSDDFQNDRSERSYFIEDETSNRRFRVRFDGRPPGHLRSGAVVRARGYAAGDELLLPADSRGAHDVEVLLPAADVVAGEQRTLVIVADFLDENVSCSAASVEDLVFTDSGARSIDAFYREGSFGALWLTGDVVGPYVIDHRSTDACDVGLWADAAEDAAWVSGIDPEAYDRKVYVLPERNSCGWAGIGQVGGTPSQAWIFRCDQPDTFAHELGHNLGMGHASTPASEYGDTSDVMGAGGWGLRHLNSPHREQMGWVDPTQVIQISSGGQYDIAPLELEPWRSGAPRALKIAKPDTGEFYYLSYRQPIGFDANLAYTYLSRLTVHLHAGASSARRTYLLQTLADGESFVDAANGLSVGQVSHGEDGVTVSVEFDPVADPSPPTDSSPPTAPTGLVASAKRKQVALSWNPATDDVGVTGYSVLRDGTSVGKTTETAYSDRSVDRGAIYTYRVVAHDGAGNVSATSSAVTVMIPGGGGKGKKR
jgi:hypothetical protein